MPLAEDTINKKILHSEEAIFCLELKNLKATVPLQGIELTNDV
jgi:hypothetical protein